MNVTAYNHLKGISRRNRHRYKTLICFTAFSPLKSNAFYFNLRNYFAIAYLSLSVYINIQFVGVNWFTENSERDWLMSSIGTFWLANALGERRAIAERHSTEVECLKKYPRYMHDIIPKIPFKSFLPLPPNQWRSSAVKCWGGGGTQSNFSPVHQKKWKASFVEREPQCIKHSLFYQWKRDLEVTPPPPRKFAPK